MRLSGWLLAAASMLAPAPGRAADAPACTVLSFRRDDHPLGNRGIDVCYRSNATFSRTRPANRTDREEAERWLVFDPMCESYLTQTITDLQDQIAKAAAATTPVDVRVAACELDRYKTELLEAQIDRHLAYDIIQDALHDEQDSKLWPEQITLGGFLLGGAGDARDRGLDIRWDTRTFFPAAGFRSGVSIGLHATSGLVYERAPSPSKLPAFEPLPRDLTERMTVPVLAGLSWSWIHSSIYFALGGSWTPSADYPWALVGQVGIGFLENWVHHQPGDNVGPTSEVRFVVQPVVPLPNTRGPTSVLFGVELGAGFGLFSSHCNPNGSSAGCARGGAR